MKFMMPYHTGLVDIDMYESYCSCSLETSSTDWGYKRDRTTPHLIAD